MKKILLTSAGFENERIRMCFLELADKNATDIKALFITTAAIEPDAIMVLPKCLNDLLNSGIPKDNIIIYDMHRLVAQEEINQYDVVYVCGGRTSYLVDRINEVGFKKVINEYINNGGIYIGVSAGSVAASGRYKDGLNLIKNVVNVHSQKGSSCGFISSINQIDLTDKQAILITDNEISIIE